MDQVIRLGRMLLRLPSTTKQHCAHRTYSTRIACAARALHTKSCRAPAIICRHVCAQHQMAACCSYRIHITATCHILPQGACPSVTQPLCAAREIVSSLTLQKTLYFNVWWSSAWWIATVVILVGKVQNLPAVR